MNDIKVNDYVVVKEGCNPYCKKGTKGYINHIYDDGTASMSKVDSDYEFYVNVFNLKVLERNGKKI
jgi:hypothetical protein